MSGENKIKFNNVARFGNTLRTYKDVCFYCSCKIDEYSRTVDHLIPRCDGGILSNDNKVNSCKKCNGLKADMHPHEFVKFIDSMIRFRQLESKESIGYLKKVKNKVNKMIDNRKNK